MATNAPDFTAAPSILGYVYQFQIALLAFLDNEDPTAELSLETLDDVSIEGDRSDLFQVKFQINPGSVTDGSAELWKTLRVWSHSVATNPDASLTLITRAVTPEGSVASLLRHDNTRDPARACKQLVAYARATKTESLQSAREAFLALTDVERESMVERIVVADAAVGFQNLDDEFERALKHAAPSDRRRALVTRLREWWVARATSQLIALTEGRAEPMSAGEVEARIADIRDQLTLDNLPIDTEGFPSPTQEEIDSDQRAFVMQLRLIALSNQRIGRAIHDHNRAFAQRARWVREDLVHFGELASFESRLVEEWERLWLPETDDELADLDETAARVRGRAIQQAMDSADVSPIRQRVTAPFVTRGSVQILADELRLGWHHDWVARVQELLAQVSK